uniref:Reverse transcriptase domain-containing protein n=1 Tax=Chromera velia CCMP2878 TaxID=1169474 RepID=A0A0G4FSW1_9ALVE|eukprot:Cvel_3704.t1-p1 / transcript=Cvel_3704.t1 / gene=Cvel_3704 / organism=Chromera_velia_CCMP2878 / gene_product=Transposon Ty3-I Gag-Pol polyprotein, putative / transcript_product=Transposon Ty3-I Gag-Pol polyprotein, putative / location=Cvel_scaffold154:40431-41996(-) / protein_length=254 / sequence_SO=supercontig / SO=protein_coding / is_pseudo=false
MSVEHSRMEEKRCPTVQVQVASVEVKPRPWVSALLFGKPASALLDSGSQVSFVDVGYLATADVEMKSPSVGLVALGNNSVPCVGETIISEIAHPSDPGKTFEHPVLVAEGSGYDIVLGMDFLRWYPEVRYAFEKDRLQVGDLPEFGVWYDDGVEPTKDLFPLPRIQETLYRLAGSSVFSALDYTSGYHQILLDPDDAEKTAFITPFGLFEFVKMLFGLVNAPAIFQRAMSIVLAALPRDIALSLIYVDDVIVFS